MKLSTVIAAAGLLLSSVPAGAQPAASAPAPASEANPLSPIQKDPFLQLETYRLWPGRAPGAGSDAPDETPTMTVFYPQPGYANGTAVVVAPGGAYINLAASLEGRQVADWFASRGVTAFVLRYRVGERARLPTPLADGARAIRWVRANAAKFKLVPSRIGMIGFSAGGHLSATTAATADAGKLTSADPVERVSSRPDFLVLGYPWLEGTALDPKGQSQYCMFARKFGKADCRPQNYERFMPVRFVTATMPPTFLYHTTSDELVPVEGSLRFYSALRAKGVPVELHAFAVGRHGTGLGGADPALARWPELLENWLRAQGLLAKQAAGG